jgi:putative tryptophan/tyrosine transport system substrate-binding protein
MRRRRILARLAALLAAPKCTSAQQSPPKIPRVGILSVGDDERAPTFEAFRAGLRDLGYIEGRDIILEFRFARGNRWLGPQLAAELAALDVIVLEGIGPNQGRYRNED